MKRNMANGGSPAPSERLARAALAAVLALATCVPAGALAFADDGGASVGAPSGAGATELTVQLMAAPDGGYGGTVTDPVNNPSADPDDPYSVGQNMAFTAPTKVNFVAKADGSLIAPTNAAIADESAVVARVSSVKVTKSADWTFVGKNADHAASNSVKLQFGPSADPEASGSVLADEVDAAAYAAKAAVGNAAAWQMGAAGSSSDELPIAFNGAVANVTTDISQQTKFGTIEWYVAPAGLSKHTVTFNSGEGSAVDPQEVPDGECATKPANPTLSHKSFVGWFTDAALTSEYGFNTPVTQDITLYAKWGEYDPFGD